MKILCLHGLRHSGEKMSSSMKTLIKKFKNVEFVFANSPYHYVDDDDSINNSNIDNALYQWWSATRNNALTVGTYDTISESVTYIVDILNRGNFDGILGFSQGAVLGQIVMCSIQNGVVRIENGPSFFISFSPSVISDQSVKDFCVDKLNAKSIVFAGIRDDLVDTSISKIVADLMGSVYVEHGGGHYVCSDKIVMYALNDFFEEFSIRHSQEMLS